jgi:photosystem II stability/assembly factor-like uncharacterized protein
MSADGSIQYVCEYGGRIWKSADSGASWSEVRPAGDANRNWSCICCDADGSVMVAGIDNGRLYLSTDGGGSCTEVTPAGSVNKKWRAVRCDSDGSVIIAVVHGGRAYKSINTGGSWTELTPAGAVDKYWLGAACDADGSVMQLSYGVSGANNYLSTNTGGSWAAPSMTMYQGGACACDSDGSVLLYTDSAAGYGGVNVSVDGGASFARYAKEYAVCGACDADGSFLIFGCCPGGLWESTDSGGTWTQATPPGTGSVENWRTVACDADGTVRLAGVYGGRLYVYTAMQYVTLRTLEFPAALNPITLVPGSVSVALPTLTFPAVINPIALDVGGRTIRILSPRGTLDTPEIIIDTTPEIDWAFTRTQGAYYLTIFDETDQIPVYDSGRVADAGRTHTVATALTPGHTYSVQVKCEDTLGEVFTSDERAWFHVNDATVDAPTLDPQSDTDQRTPVTLTWTAPATNDGDALTYEVEVTYPNGQTVTYAVGADTSLYMGYLPYE